ncbi:MAG: hypothetical protein ACOC0N_09120 [Chroococcales cyanobacterium]
MGVRRGRGDRLQTPNHQHSSRFGETGKSVTKCNDTRRSLYRGPTLR